jgi:hypothetical protein
MEIVPCTNTEKDYVHNINKYIVNEYIDAISFVMVYRKSIKNRQPETNEFINAANKLIVNLSVSRQI